MPDNASDQRKRRGYLFSSTEAVVKSRPRNLKECATTSAAGPNRSMDGCFIKRCPPCVAMPMQRATLSRPVGFRPVRPARPILLLLLSSFVGQCGVLAEFTRLSSRTVTTKYGALKGYIETPNGRHLQPVEVFLGVPYATPPTGAMRFMPPGTPVHWRGVRMADRPAPVCPQRFPDIRNESDALKRMPVGRLEYLRRLLPHLQRQSEDCLYLNIYTPAIGECAPFLVLPGFLL